MLERLCRSGFWVLAALLAVAVIPFPSKWLTDYFLNNQDLAIALVLAAAFALAWLCLYKQRGTDGPGLDPKYLFATHRLGSYLCSRPLACVWALAGVCLTTSLVGAHLVYGDYALSLDEFMARFDGVILSQGKLVATIPAQWRDFAGALQPQFTRLGFGRSYWSSTYLPVNAGLQALGAVSGVRTLSSAVMAALCVPLVYDAGRRLWPERPGIGLIAAALLASSSQFLIAAMTSYAMTGHLALNLLWLTLFLRGGRLGHIGALLVGALACGLHQLVFHPLFVAPFILQSALDRRWRVTAFYVLGYAAICGFWVRYPALVQSVAPVSVRLAAVGAGVGASSDPNGAIAQLSALLHAFDPGGIGLMAKNLIRFVTWQNSFVVPFIAPAAVLALRAGGTPRSLASGILITLVTMFVLLPYQGHGWGYRYLHGLLGSICLLVAWGSMQILRSVPEAETSQSGAVGLVVIVSILTVVLPAIRMAQTRAFVWPYAAAEAAILASGRDFVLVDDRGSLFTVDLVRNDPFLKRRPLVFALNALDTRQIEALCARGSVAVFDKADATRFGIRVFPVRDTVASRARRAALSENACVASGLRVRDRGGRPPA